MSLEGVCVSEADVCVCGAGVCVCVLWLSLGPLERRCRGEEGTGSVTSSGFEGGSDTSRHLR